jgi:phospholipid transport system substrate-binding protein
MHAMRRRPLWISKIAGLCLALAVAAPLAVRPVAAVPAGPQDTMRSFYATLLATMKQGPRLGESGRYAALAPAVREVFDVPFMTRLAVGPDWAGMTPAQQQEVTAAFGRYVAATYADRFDRYNGEELLVEGEQPFAGGFIVHTKIGKPSDDPTTINYLMRDNAGRWQIEDVYLDGTISQLATQRSEFHSILRRKGVDGLITALNQKVDLLNQERQ